MLGALCVVGLLVGFGVWIGDLIGRDPEAVPVMRAVHEPMR